MSSRKSTDTTTVAKAARKVRKMTIKAGGVILKNLLKLGEVANQFHGKLGDRENPFPIVTIMEATNTNGSAVLPTQYEVLIKIHEKDGRSKPTPQAVLLAVMEALGLFPVDDLPPTDGK